MLCSASSASETLSIRQGYGMTEMSPAATIATVTTDKPNSIGCLVPNMEMKIVDVETKEVLPIVGADGKPSVGEFWYRGPNIMLGYLNNPEATAETVDADGFLHTGDVGYMDSDGDCFIVDRCKELIKVKGFQVAPAELEDVLCGHQQVAAAAVIGIPDERSGELPKAFIQLQAGVEESDALKQELIDFCGANLTAYKKLAEVEFIALVPKSAAGKILRKLLRTKPEAARETAPAETAAVVDASKPTVLVTGAGCVLSASYLFIHISKSDLLSEGAVGRNHRFYL